MLSYNISVYEGTKHMPYESIFDKTAQIPASESSLEDKSNTIYVEYLISSFNRLKHA